MEVKVDWNRVLRGGDVSLVKESDNTLLRRFALSMSDITVAVYDFSGGNGLCSFEEL